MVLDELSSFLWIRNRPAENVVYVLLYCLSFCFWHLNEHEEESENTENKKDQECSNFARVCFHNREEDGANDKVATPVGRCSERSGHTNQMNRVNLSVDGPWASRPANSKGNDENNHS